MTLTEPAVVLVVASTIDNARSIISHMDVPGRAIPVSTRSVRGGAGRGLIATDVVIDETLWPLTQDVLAELCPSTTLAAWWLWTLAGLQVLHP